MSRASPAGADAIIGFQRLDQFAAMGKQAVLKIDAGQGGRQLAKVSAN